MKIPNKTILTLLVIFTLLNLCDVVTTMFIIKGESNPIVNLVGNMWIMVFFKFLLVAFIWIYALRNLYPSNMSYFILIAILIYGSLALTIAQVVNINAMIHPSVLAQAVSTPVAQRTQSYAIVMSIVYMIPILLTLLTFWLYERSRATAIIDKDIAQRNKWNIWRIQR
jgi:hypothetical protein